MEEVELTTKRGIKLNGVLFKSEEESDTVMICITGLHDNFSTSPFYYNLGEELPKHDIDFLYAETPDAKHKVLTVNVNTGEEEYVGSFNEDFENTIDDITTYMDYVQEHYKHIILAGHSLGANKVAYYLSENPDNRIEHFMFISPLCIQQLYPYLLKDERTMIVEYMKNNKEDEMLPFKLFNLAQVTARTAYMWLLRNKLKVFHSNVDADFEEVSKITNDGAIIIGQFDSYVDNQKNLIENINNHMQTKDENILKIVEFSGHNFEASEIDLTNTINEILKEWEYF